MGLCELRYHTQSSDIPELEGAQPRNQVGFNRFWKRETQRAGKCRLSLGLEEGDEQKQKLYKERGVKCCVTTPPQKEKNDSKKNNLNEWRLCICSSSVLL